MNKVKEKRSKRVGYQKRKFISLFTAIIFTTSQIGILPQGWASPTTNPFPQEVKLEAKFDLMLPSELGNIQTLNAGPGPTLIHIQTAHGNYEAQKKIEAILHYLKDTYGIKLLLLEGTSFKLNPELLHFFPKRMDLTKEIAEDLAKKALIKGSELFLLEAKDAEAYGIENREAYVSNGKAFVDVITQKEKTEQFLKEMDLQIERLSSPYLSPNLRSFLKQLERFENKTFPFFEWLTSLKTQAKEHLEIDLSNPSYQLDWPMLFRLFKLKEFESKLDMAAFQRERPEFLKVISQASKETYQEVEKLLSSPLSQHQLPDPETGLLFERMVSELPRSFQYETYPNVTLFIGHLILQSELKGERLVKEMDKLTDQISQKLADTQEAKALLSLLKDYRLLKRLFALELTPEDFEALNTRGELIRPEKVFSRFLELNQTKRVENIDFSHREEIDSLFEKAFEFYRGVKARDQWMLQNIEARLRETGESKAVVITGGFHAEPFTDYFKKHGFSYALIAPKITTTEGKGAYLEATLQNTPPQFIKATRETVFPYGLFLRQARLEGANPSFIVDKLIGAELGVAERNGVLFEMDKLSQGPTSNNFGLSYRSPVKGAGGKAGVVIATNLDRLTGGRRKGTEEIFIPFGEKRTIRRVVIEAEETPALNLRGLRRRTVHPQALQPIREGPPPRAEVRTDVEKAYRSLWDFYHQLRRETNFSPSQLNKVEALHESVEWEGRHVEVIAGFRGSPFNVEKLLEFARPILDSPEKWLIAYEGAEDLIKLGDQYPTIEGRFLWELSQDYKIPVVGSVPFETDAEVVTEVAERLGLEEEKVYTAYLFSPLYFALAKHADAGSTPQNAIQSFLEYTQPFDSNPLAPVKKYATPMLGSEEAQLRFAEIINQASATTNLVQVEIDQKKFLKSGSPAIDAGDPTSPLDPDGTRADTGVFFFDQRSSSQTAAVDQVLAEMIPRSEARAFLENLTPTVAEIVEPGNVRKYLSQLTARYTSPADIETNPSSQTIPTGQPISRRDFLKATGAGIGALVMAGRTSPVSAQESVAPTISDQAKATYKGMTSLFEDVTGLAVDKARVAGRGQVQMVRNNVDFMKTSPTNIGLGIVSILVAREQRWITAREAETQLAKVITTLEKMERVKGFWFNWYDLRNVSRGGAPRVTLNQFVSSVDNANLTAALMVMREAFDGTPLADRIQKLLSDQDWKFLYNQKTGLMNHGYDAQKREFSQYDYGTFNTEARLLAFIAVLNGVDRKAWDNMSRDMRVDKSGKILVVAPWGGSLFEALFANLFIGSSGVIEQNSRDIIQIHINKAQELGYSIWGWSPGLDPNGEYKEFGVPEIGIRGGGKGYPVGAVTVYSALLASPYFPTEVTKNLANMRKLNADVYHPDFGYRDSIDPKTGRVAPDILSLDKGMEVTGLDMAIQRGLRKPGTAEAFFWKYLERIKKTQQAKEILSREDKKFEEAKRQFRESQPQEAKKIDRKFDFLEMEETGDWYTPGQGKVSRTTVEDSDRKRVLRIDYDVRRNGSFNGTYHKQPRNPIDPTIHEATHLVIGVRGDAKAGFTKSFKVELKRRGQKVQEFIIDGITEKWQDKVFILKKDLGRIDEVVTVFENIRADVKQGAILVSDISLAVVPRSEARVPSVDLLPIGKRETGVVITPVMVEKEITEAVRKNFEGPTDKTLLRRFEIFGRAFQETALKTLGVEPAFAETAIPATVDFTKIEQEISSLGALKSYFPPRTESQPTSPRALYDYRGVFSETPQDYDLLLLQAASDRNLKLSVWLNATEEQLNILQTKLTQYAQSRYGFYPQNLKIEIAPQNVIGELFARARKGKLPTGFVSSDRDILPQVNAGRGIILAIGSSQTTVQNLTATLLAERLLNFSPDQLDPRIYTGEDLAEGRWAELVASLEARQAMLAAA